MADREELKDLVARALAEDLGAGDITSEAVVPGDAAATARIVQKQPGLVFGLEVAGEVFARAGAEAFEGLRPEGEWHDSVPVDVALANGPARALLAAERTALNLLCHLSGVATLTARFVDAVQGTGATILDTRKTIPGLRSLEKAAVAAGGGRNHRMGLHDAILIKENHIALAGGLAEAVRRARQAEPQLELEVECRNARRGRGGARRRRRPASARQHDPGGAASCGRGSRRGWTGARPGGDARGFRRHRPRQCRRGGGHRGRLHLHRRPDPLRPGAGPEHGAGAG